MGGASVYGGYFTAAQGVLYLGILGIFTGRSMGSVNSIKNLLSLVVNLAAAIVYVIAHFVLGVEIVWLATAAIAVGALLGGYFGAHLAKRMPEWCCAASSSSWPSRRWCARCSERQRSPPRGQRLSARNGRACASTSSGGKRVPP